MVSILKKLMFIDIGKFFDTTVNAPNKPTTINEVPINAENRCHHRFLHYITSITKTWLNFTVIVKYKQFVSQLLL